VSIVASVISHFWFTILGGSGIFYELKNSGSVSAPLLEDGLPAAIISIANQLPLGSLLVIALLVLTLVFVVTTADSTSFSFSMAEIRDGEPPTVIRVNWEFMMRAISIILLNIAAGSMDTLQSFLVVTAFPISNLMLQIIWTTTRIAKKLAIEQNIITSKDLSSENHGLKEYEKEESTRVVK